eukprot:5430317-Pleurochrysis_carterae.AAC.4
MSMRFLRVLRYSAQRRVRICKVSQLCFSTYAHSATPPRMCFEEVRCDSAAPAKLRKHAIDERAHESGASVKWSSMHGPVEH